MRFTIERLRTLVLAAGVVLIAALVVFLARGKLKNPLNLKELPQKLGVNITADASGFTLDHSFGGHSRYRIHASKAVQYKDNRAVLHDVKIELFGEDGSRMDLIQGAEFEYDQKNGTASAAGPVQITLTRPATTSAIAGKAAENKAGENKAPAGKPNKGKSTPILSAAETAARGEVHVKTSGLTFDTKSGVATTAQRVDFSMVQGSGSAIGASYDSKGLLVLDKDVALNALRGGETVVIRAQHAEFEREARLCRLHVSTADYRGAEATAGDATVLFRDDGSAVRLDAVNGFNLRTATGGHLAAPTGSMDFNEQNQPQHAHLEGGVRMDSTRQIEDGAGQRRMRGSAPAAELDFTPRGILRHVHLERGVDLESEQVGDSAKGPLRVKRTWNSPVTDVDFRDNGHGQAEPSTIRGVQGVVVTGESQRGNASPVPSRFAADEVTGQFGVGSALTEMVGTGHARLDQTSATGARQTSTGDRLEVHFAEARGRSADSSGAGPSQGEAGQIQSAVLNGHVELTQEPAPQPTAKKEAQEAAILHAWAGRAEYEGQGEWLHLTLSPRVEDGGLQMTADKIDVAHDSGDAFARGNVKATWLGAGAEKTGERSNGGAGVSGHGDVALGGQGPAHVIASEAQLHQATGEATFRGHARLWQQANSVAGPMIVLDRQKQTLVARSADPADPVSVVLLSAGGLEPGTAARNPAEKSGTPSVIRVHGGDLKYSDAERKAVMHGGALGTVEAETGSATSVSNEVELVLLPPGNHAGKDGGQAQVDRMTARGRVVVTSGGRSGTGEQLVYTGESGQYVLTGTAATPPRMTDPARGKVTGAALIFNSRDDSVSIEGGGRRTTTETRTPK